MGKGFFAKFVGLTSCYYVILYSDFVGIYLTRLRKCFLDGFFYFIYFERDSSGGSKNVLSRLGA